MTTEQTTSRAESPVRTPCVDQFASLGPARLVDRYRAGVHVLDMRVVELHDEQLDRPFDPARGLGLWSCRALLTHVMDAEMLYAMRLRRTIVEDAPVFENWDEQAFIASRLSAPGPDSLLMPAGALLASIYTTRQANATWLVQLGPDDWTRRAMTPVMGEADAHRLLVYAAWHLEHHGAYLNAKIVDMLGPAPEAPAHGGCGSGCCCSHDHQE
ncbi:MAG: DinB family protein [Phycisphaeraceae bacterium]|nr:MAG: DinB family protein [Phycisphaeraceae bacterium]